MGTRGERTLRTTFRKYVDWKRAKKAKSEANKAFEETKSLADNQGHDIARNGNGSHEIVRSGRKINTPRGRHALDAAAAIATGNTTPGRRVSATQDMLDQSRKHAELQQANTTTMLEMKQFQMQAQEQRRTDTLKHNQRVAEQEARRAEQEAEHAQQEAVRREKREDMEAARQERADIRAEETRKDEKRYREQQLIQQQQMQRFMMSMLGKR